MGEPAYLVHSFSCAATVSHESKEDNPLHALSQSVSFGRFVTDSLEWGKWSSFSHKKYVEEAEKYSRPGSVAQKKAFFEAHYKKIAAAKKAAADELLEQQTDNPSASENACEPESAQKQEVKEKITETGLVVDADGSDFNVKKDNNSERSNAQMDYSVAETEFLGEHPMKVESLNVPGVKDNDETRDVMVPSGIEQKENYTKIEFLTRNGSFGKKDDDDDKESLKKDVSEAGKCSTPRKIPTAEAKHSLSVKRSESKAKGSSDKARKSVIRRQGLLPMNCLFKSFGSRTEEQEASKKKDKSEKNRRKSRWSLCFKPKLSKER